MEDQQPQHQQPKGDGNDDPDNAILVTGFSPDRQYSELNHFFRGIGKIRRCFLRSQDPRWCVVTYEFNVSEARKQLAYPWNATYGIF